MVEEKEREKPKQVRKRIEPMLFYDKSKLVDPMEEVKHDPQNLPKSREQFWAEMEAKFRTPSEKASVPEPAGQPQAPAVSKEKIAQVLGISNQGAVQQMPANMSGVIANQDGTVAPKLDISLAEVSAGKKEGPTPLDLVKKLKRHVSMCVVDGKLYVYSHGYYQMMTQNDMETEIWAICRQEVEQTGSKSILTGAYQLLLVDPDLTAARLLPADNLVPLRNGLLRLDDGAFLMHSPACFLTFVLQCDYTPSYGCPVFEQYLNDVTAGDPLLIARIWEFIGCCLTQVDIKTIFVLQGVPSSGKSAFRLSGLNSTPQDVVNSPVYRTVSMLW